MGWAASAACGLAWTGITGLNRCTDFIVARQVFLTIGGFERWRQVGDIEVRLRNRARGQICPVAPRNRATGRNVSSTPRTRCHGAIRLLLRWHGGVLLSPSHASALPLGKTRCRAPGTGAISGAWAECLQGEQGNILLSWRCHDPWAYPLGIASVFLWQFVTLSNGLDTAPAALYSVPSSYG
jgi:hypothetical protein